MASENAKAAVNSKVNSFFMRSVLLMQVYGLNFNVSQARLSPNKEGKRGRSVRLVFLTSYERSRKRCQNLLRLMRASNYTTWYKPIHQIVSCRADLHVGTESEPRANR